MTHGRLLDAFPRLRGLPEESWTGRHRAIVGLLWAHVPALYAYGVLVAGHGLGHGLLDALPLAVFALAAQRPGLSRAARSCVASLGLITGSALAVHVSGGAIEAHFHFFVMLPVIGLYQDWRPFGLAVVYVVVHHSAFALVFPHDVYPESGAWYEVLARTGVHALFVVAEIAALLASWKLSESQQQALDAKNAALDARNDELDGTVASLDGTVARLDSAMSGMTELSSEVRSSAVTLAASAQEILATVSESTEAASDQSLSIEATSAAADELRRSAEDMAREADELSAQAHGSLDTAEAGATAVEAIVEGMEEIRGRMNAIAADVTALSEQTERIGALTASVTELADRSNLLALNASIEAARAGEHGRGFAVVAQEVRALAEQSKAATEEVRRILAEVDEATGAAVGSAEQGGAVVGQGAELAGRAREVIAELAEANRGTAAAAEHIAGSARAQNGGTDRIADAMTQASEGTGRFVESTQGAQAIARRLTGLAADLEELTGRYDGLDAVAEPAVPAPAEPAVEPGHEKALLPQG